MDSHKVVDLHYMADQIIFIGSLEECEEYHERQIKMSISNKHMMKIVPIVNEKQYGSMNEMRQSEDIDEDDEDSVFSHMKD